MEIKTKGFQGNIKKSARVLSNDPKNPQVTIAIKGTVWTPIQVKPRSVHLTVAVGEEMEKVVTLEGKKKEPLSIKLGSVSIPDKIAVELKEIEKGRTYQMKVKNLFKEPARYRGQVKLATNYPEKSEIVIQVAGNVRASVEARPKAVNFGRMSKERVQQLKKDGRPIQRPVTVAVASRTGNNLKIEKVELEKSLFTVATREVKPGQVFQLQVEPIMGKLKKGPNEDRLTIHTNNKNVKVLEVPIRFEIL